MLALFDPGCATQPPSATPPQSVQFNVDSPFLPDAETRAVASTRQPVHVVSLSFEVMRIDLPVDDIRHSRKLWNHVDEQIDDPALATMLARNGIRAGVADPEDWPAIAAVLDSAGARIRKDQMTPPPGQPLAVEVGQITDDEPVFVYERGRQLAGKTFDRGVRRVTVEYALDSAFDGAVYLRLGLEVLHDLGLRWRRVEGISQQVPEVEHYVFTDLIVPLTVGEGGMIVVGPSLAADNAYLVGARFFSSEVEGRPHETLLVIAPSVYRTVQPAPVLLGSGP